MRRHGRRADTIDFPALLKWNMLGFWEKNTPRKLQESISVMSVPQVKCPSRMLHILSLAEPWLFSLFWASPGCLLGWVSPGDGFLHELCAQTKQLWKFEDRPCPCSMPITKLF